MLKKNWTKENKELATVFDITGNSMMRVVKSRSVTLQLAITEREMKQLDRKTKELSSRDKIAYTRSHIVRGMLRGALPNFFINPFTENATTEPWDYSDNQIIQLSDWKNQPI